MIKQWRVFDVEKFDVLNLRHIFCTKWICSNFVATYVTTPVTQFKIKFYTKNISPSADVGIGWLLTERPENFPHI